MLLNKRRLLNLGYAVLQANILLFDYLEAVSQDYHRMFTNWQTVDLLALFLIHGLFIALAFGVFSSISNRRIRKLAPVYFLIGYLAYFLHLSFYIFLLLSILITSDLVFRLIRTKLHLYRKKLISALVAASLFVTFFQYLKIINAKPVEHIISYTSSKPVTVRDNKSPKNIIFILFDMLSYQELYLLKSKQAGIVSDRFPAFRDFSDQVWNFHAAYSPYDRTIKSIPIIIGLDQPETITSYLGALGYKTAVFGNYINYCDLLDGLSSCKSYSWYQMPSTMPALLTSSLRHLLYMPLAGDHFYKHLLIDKIKVLIDNRRTRIVQQTMESDYLEHLVTKPSNSFIYVHFNVPHPPYVFNKNGAEPDWDNLYENYTERKDAYMQNLDYTDRLFAKILTRLKELGIYDESLIIVTADHSLRVDKDIKNISMDPMSAKLQQELKAQGLEVKDQVLLSTHVPLMIKLPGQNQRQDYSGFLSNTKLFSKTNNYLFDQELKFNLKRIEELGSSIMRVPQPKEYFIHENIKHKKLIRKSNKLHVC